MSEVDVVVPCYNYARYLPACVDSVLQQKGIKARVLIIDDSSTDHSEEVGQRLARQDARVEYRRHATNRGHIATYNEGLLEWASAEYSVLLSADDALAEGALARATHLMDQHPNLGMSYGMAAIIGSDDYPPYDCGKSTDDYRIVAREDFLEHCCAKGNPVPTPTAVVRTSVQRLVGGYRKDLPHTGDLEMWMRIATRTPVAAFRAIQGYYRWHSRNMSSFIYADLLNDQRERLKACEEALGNCGGEFPGGQAWIRAARQRLGEEAFWLGSRTFDEGDTVGAAHCIRFAQDMFPQIVKTDAWAGFQLKRAAGVRLWRVLRPFIAKVRGRAPVSRPTEDNSRFKVGQINGWWPDSSEAPCGQ